MLGWVSQSWDQFTVSRQGGLGGTLGTVCFMILKKNQVNIFTSKLEKSNGTGQCSL